MTCPTITGKCSARSWPPARPTTATAWLTISSPRMFAAASYQSQRRRNALREIDQGEHEVAAILGEYGKKSTASVQQYQAAFNQEAQQMNIPPNELLADAGPPPPPPAAAPRRPGRRDRSPRTPGSWPKATASSTSKSARSIRSSRRSSAPPPRGATTCKRSASSPIVEPYPPPLRDGPSPACGRGALC